MCSLLVDSIFPLKEFFFLLQSDDLFFFFPVIRLSFDEGRSWSKYSFTSIPLFVDGVLGEPGEETLIMT